MRADCQARGKQETVIAGLASGGGGHWARAKMCVLGCSGVRGGSKTELSHRSQDSVFLSQAPQMVAVDPL